MPFVPKNETLPDLRVYSERLESPLKNDTGFEYEPTFIEAMGAKVLTETSIGSAVANKTRSTGYFDPNFDWSLAYDRLPASYKDNYGDLFTEAESQDHFDSIKDQIDFKEQNNEIIRASGWSGVIAGFAAQAVEPLNLVPFGTAARYAVKGKSMLTGAAQVALAGMTSTTAQEAVIQSQDLTRTFGESAANVAASTLLSGVIGGALYKSLAKSDPAALKDLEDKVAKSMEVEETSLDEIKKSKQKNLASVKTKSTKVKPKKESAPAVAPANKENLIAKRNELLARKQQLEAELKAQLETNNPPAQ
jgi:hypothetical protein